MAHISGWKRWLTVTDADHYSLTDLHLRDIPQRLLTGPTTDFPEITFHHQERP